MKQARSLALVLAALAAPLFLHTIRAEAEVTFAYFEEALSPFGEWIEVVDYGLCWRPTGVAADWAPYTDGYWAYTDAGWTWVSYEDWGGITYHYGRWVQVLDEGWVWVPEYQWGPAWVSWRSSEEYVGWAPLPPEARWEESTGFSTWVDTSYDIGPESYRFCHTRDFGAPVLAPVCLPFEQNVTFIVSTVNVTNICYNRHSSAVFCGGPNFFEINGRCRRPIPSLRLLCEDREERGPHGDRRPQIVRGNALAVYAPKVARPAEGRALPIQPQRVIGAEKINRGWSRLADVAVQQQIRGQLQKQTAGLNPRTAPARPVQPADLRGVPSHGVPTAVPPGMVARQANPPAVAERVPSPPERVVPTHPPVSQNTERPAQPPPPRPQRSPVAEAKSGADEAGSGPVSREQQPQPSQEETASRNALARQQQEDAQRSRELRQRDAELLQQQQQARPRAVEERRPPISQETGRTEALARQQQANANRAAALAARQQQQQQRQDITQRANQPRREQIQPPAPAPAQEQQPRQQPSPQPPAPRARELPFRQAPAQPAEIARPRQEAVSQRMPAPRPQAPPVVRQAEPPQRLTAPPASQPPARPAQSRGSDDAKSKKHSE